MSLINDALKRAEEEKRLRTDAPPPAPAAPSEVPASPEQPSPTPEQPPQAAAGTGVSAAALLEAALVPLTVLTGWLLLNRSGIKPAPEEASANVAPPAGVAVDVPFRADGALEVSPDSGVVPAVSGQPPPRTAEVLPPEAAPPASRVQPVLPEPSLADIAGAGVGQQPIPSPHAMRNPPGPDNAAPSATVAAPTMEPRPAATTPAATQPSSSAYEARFRLSGILHGPDGATAIINGFFVHAGETLDDATVVQINSHSVTLDVAGRRVTIRM